MSLSTTNIGEDTYGHGDTTAHNDDCVVHQVQEIAQGSGKKPLKVFFNRKGIKLEIVRRDVNVDKEGYLAYVETIPGDETKWRCTCEKIVDGKHIRCTYKSTKHLVKRHVESTHLNIRRFQCSWCGQ
ncbi:unnamed protein product [Peniophora sp. CBMAI 1063]|nr:unnamed protein product [Peniophora sp. CBMAI 1063]